MQTSRKILIAFLLNLSFSIFEAIGGLLTGSIAIVSDAVHDFGDAASIGIAYFLERKSKRQPDANYTYGYARYSVLGAFITTVILLLGSSFIIYESSSRLFNPIPVNYNGMLIFAIFGLIINSLAAYFTHDGNSVNQKSVNLHMLEDVLGWAVVLIGSILMRFTNLAIIDPLMSIGVALFILCHAIRNFKEILDLFLEKTPAGLSTAEINAELLKLKDIKNVHHVHLWSMDGINNLATLHVVTNTKNPEQLKQTIKDKLAKYHINHVTIELETDAIHCPDHDCHPISDAKPHHHHH